MCRDSQCRAAAGKQCFSVGICIYQVVARATSSSGSVCCGWERFIEKVIQYNYIGVETAGDVKALEARVPPIFFECCTYRERETACISHVFSKFWCKPPRPLLFHYFPCTHSLSYLVYLSFLLLLCMVRMFLVCLSYKFPLCAALPSLLFFLLVPACRALLSHR